MLAARPLRHHHHTEDEYRRIDAYRIRRAVVVGREFLPGGHGNDPLTLRLPNGHIDAGAVAMESTMRQRAHLPAYIPELDLPLIHRNPAPWNYCHEDRCTLCRTAYRSNLPDNATPLQRATRPITRALNALAAYIDTLTARLIHREPR